MASTYTTGFGIEKIGSGEQSGAWGTTTNHNLDILDRIASYKAVALSGTTHTLTVREASPGSGTENLQDGMYRVIKFTGALGGNNTVTIAPNTAPAYFIFENATTDSGSSGPYSVILTQGSGANITIQNGKNAIVYCDGAGSGAAVVNALSDLQIATLEVTGAAAIDGALTAAAITGTTLTISGVTTHGGNVVSDTDSTDDLGTTSVRWKELFVDGITATDQVTATGFTGTLDGILGSGTPAAATVTTIDASGVATATTFEPDGDTAAGDNAAIGYTAAEGLILTGQGSTSDVTIKNDADATVMSIPTGTTNVGIGTTAPAQILETKELDATGFTGIRINNPNANVGQAGVEFQVDATYSKAAIFQKREDANGGGDLIFAIDSASDAADWALTDEKVRFTREGNVGIGTAAPGALLTAGSLSDGTPATYGGTINVASASQTSINSVGGIELTVATAYGSKIQQISSGGANLTFSGRQNSATWSEYMRINASGNVGIGTTAPVAKLQVETGVDRQAIRMRNTSATAGLYWNFGPDSANSIVLENASGTGVYIGNGGTAWSSLSDERLKTNIQALSVTDGLEAINKLDTVTFSWKDARLTGTSMGLIAQSVRDVFPSLVSATSTRTIQLDDGTEQEITDPLGVEYTGLIVPLIKATQELKAIIDAQATLIASLETRITALEG